MGVCGGINPVVSLRSSGLPSQRVRHEPALMLSMDPPLPGFVLKVKETDEDDAFLRWVLRHQMNFHLERDIS